MPRKSTRGTSGSSPEKTPAVTATRRATRRGQKVSEKSESEVADEIPAHLLRGSDESSEHSDNDSDYGSPKKGRGGRGASGRGRGRKAKEVVVVEEKPTPSRSRRGRRAARDITPEPVIPEEPEQLSQEPSESTQSQTDEHDTSTIESEHTPAEKSPVNIQPEPESEPEAVVVEQKQEKVEPEKVEETVEPEKVEEENVQQSVDDEKQESSPSPLPQASTESQDQPPEVEEEKVSEVEQDLQSNNDQVNNEKVDDETESGENRNVVDVSVDEDVSKEASSESESNSNEKMQERKARSRSSSGEIHDDSCDNNTKMEVDESTKTDVPQKVEEIEEETKKDESKASGHQRKRKWGARKIDSEPVIAITTDSLKNIISEEVKPVPLSDVKLVMSPSPDREPEEKKIRVKATAEDKDAKKKLLKERLRKQEEEEERRNEQLAKVIEKRQASPTITIVANGSGMERKVSLIHDEAAPSTTAPPTPPKNQVSKVLCITNLVRPLTVISVKSLLARTGKIADFWIDQIKSKCIVKFETEE